MKIEGMYRQSNGLFDQIITPILSIRYQLPLDMVCIIKTHLNDGDNHEPVID